MCPFCFQEVNQARERADGASKKVIQRKTTVEALQHEVSNLKDLLMQGTSAQTIK